MKSVVCYGEHFGDVDFMVVECSVCWLKYGLVLGADCIDCETCYFCFDPAFVWLSLGHALLLCLACKPFPGLCAGLCFTCV